MIRAASLLVTALVALVAVVALPGCPKQADKKPTEPTPARRDAGAHVAEPGDAIAIVLPPAPPLPEVPAGLPPTPALEGVTPEAVALGELLFHDARLSRSGTLACASCHDPAHGFSGAARQPNADGKPNLRRAPALVNLAWVKELGWDGRFGAIKEFLSAHVRGQLGEEPRDVVMRISDLPRYRAHFTRLWELPATTRALDPAAPARGPVNADALLIALDAFVRTRFEGGSAWDRVEPSARAPRPDAAPDAVAGPSADVVAGYLVFAGAGQCAVCHPPPLYTDQAYHRVTHDTYQDPGRGAVDEARAGAFRTPTLRGAAARRAFMHTGALATLEDVVDGYAANARATDQRFDPVIGRIQLSARDRADLLAFLRALTAPGSPPPTPALP